MTAPTQAPRPAFWPDPGLPPLERFTAGHVWPLRFVLDLDHDGFAHSCGLTPHVLRLYESGRLAVPPATLARIHARLRRACEGAGDAQARQAG